MTTPFTLTSRISAKEFASVSLRVSLRTDISLYFAVFIGVLMLLLDFNQQNFYWSWSHLTWFTTALFLASAPLQQWLWRWREYDTLYPHLKREIEFRFFDDHFTVNAQDGQADIGWSELARLLPAGHFLIIILRDGKGTYYIDTRTLSPEQRQFIKTAYRRSRAKR
jgi:hypothetical protein